jgi:hypothetical protein
MLATLCKQQVFRLPMRHAIHKTVIDRIYRFIREGLSIKFKRKDLRPGSKSFLQRCGSLLNLNLHFHFLVMDGAYICRESKRAFFHKMPGPSDQDIANLLESIIEAVELCLRKRGLLVYITTKMKDAVG